MHPPEGFTGVPPGHIWKLSRSLYGLPQSAMVHNRETNAHLLKIGFERCSIDPCLYYRIRPATDSTPAEYSVLCLVVDDIILATTLPRGQFCQEMSTRFAMKDLGRGVQTLPRHDHLPGS